MNFSVAAGIYISSEKNRKSNPNPVIASNWNDVYRDCPAHEDCFDYSIEQDWHFWSCAECSRYKKPIQDAAKVLPGIPQPDETAQTKPTLVIQPKKGLLHRIASKLVGNR